jgi:hypothetical protein
MYGWVGEWVGSVCVCVLFLDLFEDDLMWITFSWGWHYRVYLLIRTVKGQPYQNINSASSIDCWWGFWPISQLLMRPSYYQPTVDSRESVDDSWQDLENDKYSKVGLVPRSSHWQRQATYLDNVCSYSLPVMVCHTMKILFYVFFSNFWDLTLLLLESGLPQLECPVRKVHNFVVVGIFPNDNTVVWSCPYHYTSVKLETTLLSPFGFLALSNSL